MDPSGRPTERPSALDLGRRQAAARRAKFISVRVEAAAYALGIGLSCAACSSTGTPPPCADVEGTFQLTVAGTGQSEVLTGTCPDASSTQTIDVTISHGQVSLDGETCSLCSTGSCVVDIVCGSSVTCPATVTAPESPPDTYVQTLTFVVPTADASTGNANATLGAGYCGYEGTASAN
jgi:hypothetical protein